MLNTTALVKSSTAALPSSTIAVVVAMFFFVAVPLTILGGIAGNAIAKDACQDKRQDAHYYNNAYYDSFNDPQEDERYEWTNPYTNNPGYVSAGEYYDEGYQDFDGPCREFTQSVYIDGRPEQATGVACRQQDGTWRIVSGQ